MKRHLIPLLSALVASACPLGAAAARIPNDKCLECHEDKDLTKDLPGGKTLSMYVDAAKLKESVHAKTQCA